MKPFPIGQCVLVTAVSTLEYDEHNQRQVIRHPCEPFFAVLTGQAIRMLGQFNKGNPAGGYEDYEQAYLKVSGSVTFWTARAGMVNKELLIGDDDFLPSEYKSLPRQARRVKYIYEDVLV